MHSIQCLEYVLQIFHKSIAFAQRCSYRKYNLNVYLCWSAVQTTAIYTTERADTPHPPLSNGHFRLGNGDVQAPPHITLCHPSRTEITLSNILFLSKHFTSILPTNVLSREQCFNLFLYFYLYRALKVRLLTVEDSYLYKYSKMFEIYF